MISTGLLVLTILSQASSIMLDRIVAIVDDQIITFSDVEKAISLFPNFRSISDTDENFYLRVVNELIDYRVVFREFQTQFTLDEEDYEVVQTAILQKAGSLEKLRGTIARFQLDWPGFRSFIAERVFYEKVLRQKFAMNIIIPFPEIERFYQTEYLQVQRQYELQPASLVEMAPVIEQHLRKLKTEERLAGWLSEIRTSHQVEIRFGGIDK